MPEGCYVRLCDYAIEAIGNCPIETIGNYPIELVMGKQMRNVVCDILCLSSSEQLLCHMGSVA
jgi:hypothetical protein